jgi:hypothetical protein
MKFGEEVWMPIPLKFFGKFLEASTFGRIRRKSRVIQSSTKDGTV